jgi:hypothetical protein
VQERYRTLSVVILDETTPWERRVPRYRGCAHKPSGPRFYSRSVQRVPVAHVGPHASVALASRRWDRKSIHIRVLLSSDAV